MIRFDQRGFDVQGTERVFKKCVQPGQNSLRLVDKDGVPMRGPNTQALSRLHSTYVLSPRGVPTRKSTHAYSGQLAQGKMQSLVNSLETSSQEMASYTSMHSYGNGLSSAGSSRHYIPANLTPKKRAFGSGPPQSMKSGTAKSSSSRQTSRYLTSAPSREGMEDIDKEQSNDSPQGKRLEKEWSALSQCRALKRSSEIVSHRVDRMYFMTGNKLQLQSKYHVEEEELKTLRELSQARAVSRASRSSRSRKGDVYRPDRSAGSRQTSGSFNTDDTKLSVTSDPKVMVSPKVLTPKPAPCKSPLEGWAKDETKIEVRAGENDIGNSKLHEENNVENPADGVDAGEAAGDVQKGEDKENEAPQEQADDTAVDKDNGGALLEGHTKDNDNDQEGKSVHNADSDKDRTDVKSEDYIGKEPDDSGRQGVV